MAPKLLDRALALAGAGVGSQRYGRRDRLRSLGLASVYGIVKQNDGCIEVDSEVGRGTTVRIFCRASSRT